MTPLQQMTFENIVTNEEITQNEQFLLLPQCLQLCSVHDYTYIYGDFLCFCVNNFKAICCRISVCGKGLIKSTASYIFRYLSERKVSEMSIFSFDFM